MRHDIVGDTSSTDSDDLAVDLLPHRRVGALSASKDSLLQYFMNRYFLPTLFHPVGAAFILLAMATAIIVGIVGASRLGEGLQISTLAPDGHFLKPFDAVEREFRAYAGMPLPDLLSQFLACPTGCACLA
jgi:hypothetical protein